MSFKIGNTTHCNFKRIDGIIYIIYSLNNKSENKKLILCGFMKMNNWLFVKNNKNSFAISTYDKLKQNSFKDKSNNKMILFK